MSPQPTLRRRPREKALAAGAAVFAGVVLLLPFLPPPDVAEVGWGAFLGRLHPLLVHFPIVFVAVPLLLEAAARLTGRAAFRTAVPFFWLLAALSTLATVGAGYLLYASGDYGGALVTQHLWAGVLLALAVLAAAVLYIRTPVETDPRWQRLYLGALLVANGLVLVVGHLGGSLTHGEAFLTDALPPLGVEAPVEARSPEELRVFGDLIMPAFEARCLTCHNAQKAKGELVMTSFETLRQGGESGDPALVPGDAEASAVYARVALPLDHDDHMPPAGKPQLGDDEIALLAWWIDAGADPEMRLGTGPEDPEMRALLQRYLPRLALTQRRRIRDARERAALLATLQREAAQWGVVVAPDPFTDSLQFALSMQVPPVAVGDAVLAALPPYAEAFSTLSLVSSDITDDGLYHLGHLTGLRRLILARTDLDGSGLVYLQALPALETINLSHTKLDDAGALHLLQFPALREVYLFDTSVSDAVLAALRTHRPEITWHQTEGPYF